MRTRFVPGEVGLDAECRDLPTAGAVLAAFPFEAAARTWGDEVRFPAPVAVTLEPDARHVAAAGRKATRCGCASPEPGSRADTQRRYGRNPGHREVRRLALAGPAPGASVRAGSRGRILSEAMGSVRRRAGA